MCGDLGRVLERRDGRKVLDGAPVAVRRPPRDASKDAPVAVEGVLRGALSLGFLRQTTVELNSVSVPAAYF